MCLHSGGGEWYCLSVLSLGIAAFRGQVVFAGVDHLVPAPWTFVTHEGVEQAVDCARASLTRMALEPSGLAGGVYSSRVAAGESPGANPPPERRKRARSMPSANTWNAHALEAGEPVIRGQRGFNYGT
jgi:hypothetical protein